MTIVEVLVLAVIAMLVISVLLPRLTADKVSASRAFCSNNQAQFLRALHIYAQEYKYFPPHNPLPGYWPDDHPAVQLQGAGFDPSLGWLMTCAMRMTPPVRFGGGHFKWFVLGEDELPDICVCPAARRDLLFAHNPELGRAPWESLLYPYAASYQCSGTIRSATAPRVQAGGGSDSCDRNPCVADPSEGLASAQPVRNAVGNMPYVRVAQHKPGAMKDDPAGGEEFECWVQAVQPAEVDNPGRVYYLADSREYRPERYRAPAAGTSDGWHSGYGNQVLLGTRHGGFAQIAYLDGHVSSDNETHLPSWALNPTVTGRDGEVAWRCATFGDPVRIADIGTSHHLMPVLNVRGWEWLFPESSAR